MMVYNVETLRVKLIGEEIVEIHKTDEMGSILNMRVSLQPRGNCFIVFHKNDYFRNDKLIIRYGNIDGLEVVDQQITMFRPNITREFVIESFFCHYLPFFGIPHKLTIEGVEQNWMQKFEDISGLLKFEICHNIGR